MPDIELPKRNDQHRVWLATAGWTVVVCGVALILRADDGLPLWRAVVSTGVWYYSLGGFVWAACAIDVRRRLWKRSLARMLFAHATIGVGAISAWIVIVLVFARVAIGPDYWRLVFESVWMYQLLTTTMIYAAGVGIGLIVQRSDREHEREARERQLEVLARETELSAIRAQLQPHFLFNSLNSILALLDDEPAEARRMLMRLSSLLYSVFDRLDEPVVPLTRELETVRDYLEIERIRFGDRLKFTIDAEPGAHGVLVPPFLLQPLVENAVKHGIEPHSRSGEVRVTARLDGARLRLAVVDTGPGVNGEVLPGHGRGLALTRRRLETMYGSGGATLQTEHHAEGFAVAIELPVTADVA